MPSSIREHLAKARELLLEIEDDRRRFRAAVEAGDVDAMQAEVDRLRAERKAAEE